MSVLMPNGTYTNLNKPNGVVTGCRQELPGSDEYAHTRLISRRYLCIVAREDKKIMNLVMIRNISLLQIMDANYQPSFSKCNENTPSFSHES